MECRLCGQDELIKVYKAKDYLTEKTFDILRCRACGFIQTAVLNTPPSYPPIYYGTNNSWFKGIFNKTQNILVKRDCDYTVKTTLKVGRVLDIGCGNGLFLKQMEKRGWKILGTEATPESADFTLKSSGIQPLIDKNLTNLEIQTNYFDIVTMWHVFEHMEQPTECVEKIYTLLNRQGYLVLEVPNIESLQAKIFGKNWFHLDVPRHINHFSVNTLTKLLQSNKYDIVRVETLSWGHGVYGWLQSTANLTFGDNNTTYKTLKMGMGGANGRDALKLSFLLLTIPFFILLETFASLVGRGAVVRVTAKKVV